jgi:hypothetical protein
LYIMLAIHAFQCRLDLVLLLRTTISEYG